MHHGKYCGCPECEQPDDDSEAAVNDDYEPDPQPPLPPAAACFPVTVEELFKSYGIRTMEAA